MNTRKQESGAGYAMVVITRGNDFEISLGEIDRAR